MKSSKKVLSLLMTTALMSGALVGCGSLDNSATVLTIGGEEVSAGVANFYARYQQSLYEDNFGSFLGDDLWITEIIEGETYQETVKTNVMSILQELYVVRQHADELEISLSDEEVEAIEAVAESFLEANTNVEDNELASITKENVVEILSLLTLQKKADPIIKADVDTDVTDEDTVQKKMTVVSFEFTYTDDAGELVTFEEEVQEEMYAAFEELLAAGGDLLELATEMELTVEEVTFDATSTVVDPSLITAADELEKDEYTEIIETGSAYCLAQVTSLNDEEATEAKIEEIIATRASELYEEVIEAWILEAGAEVETKVWAQIDFEKLGVIMPVEDTSGVTTYESTYEFGSAFEDEESEEGTEESEEVESEEVESEE